MSPYRQTHDAITRRGSVLVLVVAVLGVLFVVGLGFLAMARQDRQTADSVERRAAVNLVATAVINQVHATLSEDLWDGGSVLLGDGTSNEVANEPWDAPYSNPTNFGKMDDPWLAVTLPETVSGGYRWPHVTNLSGLADFGRGVSDTDVLDSDLEADADGDGIKDSRWLLSPDGRFRYAVRIVDLCSMINLNTARDNELSSRGGSLDEVGAKSSNFDNSYHDPNLNTLASTNYGREGRYAVKVVNESNQYGTYTVTTYPAAQYFHLDDPDVGAWFAANYSTATVPWPIRSYEHTELSKMIPPFPYRPCDTVALLAYGIKPGPGRPRLASGWPSTFSERECEVADYVPTWQCYARDKMPDIRLNAPTAVALRIGDPPENDPYRSDSYRMYYTTFNWTRNLRPNVLPSTPLPRHPDMSKVLYPFPTEELKAAWWRRELDAYDPSGLGRVYINEPNPHAATFTRALAAAFALSGAMGDGGLSQREVEQLIVNLVDYRDANQVPSVASSNPAERTVDTVWNRRDPETETVLPPIYGNEPQPFISELAARLYPNVSGAPSPDNCYAVELFNPYSCPINIGSWQLYAGSSKLLDFPADTVIGPGARMVLCNLNATQEVAPDDRWPAAPRDSVGDTMTNPTESRRLPVAATTLVPALKLMVGTAAQNIVLRRRAANGDILLADVAKVANIQSASANWLTPPGAGYVDYHVCRYDERWMQTRDLWSVGSMAATQIARYEGYTFGWANSCYVKYDASTSWSWRYVRDEDLINAAWTNYCANGRAAPVPTACFADWNKNSFYRAGDIVHDAVNGTYWKCRENHTARHDYITWDDLTSYVAAWSPNVWIPKGEWELLGGAPATFDFDTLSRLHLLMTVGPERTNGQAATELITAATTADDVQKLYLDFSDRRNALVLRYLERLTRRHNGADDNSHGGVDDASELRLPGLVNINTATPHVLRHLSWYLCPRDPWTASSDPAYYKGYPWIDLNQSIYNYRTDSPGRGFTDGVGELMKVSGTTADVSQVMSTLAWSYSADIRFAARHMNSACNQPAELIYYELPGNNDASFRQATPGDPHEKHFLFDRISDLVTDRSDTFLAYILVEEIRVKSTGGNYYSDGDVSRGRRQRTVAIFDRSVCNYPPTDSQHYIPPQVVARSVSTCEIP